MLERLNRRDVLKYLGITAATWALSGERARAMSGTVSPIQGNVANTLANPSKVALQQLGLAIDVVRDYNASGSSSSTTGTISAGSKTLTLASALDFKNPFTNSAGTSVAQGISIAGAGASGALLVTTIVSGAGTTTLTLADAASTAVTAAAVNHDDTAAIQAWLLAIATASTANSGPGARGVAPFGTYMISSTVDFSKAFTSSYRGVAIDMSQAYVKAVTGFSGSSMIYATTPDNQLFDECDFRFGTIDGSGIGTFNGLEVRYFREGRIELWRATACDSNSAVFMNMTGTPTEGIFNNEIIIHDLELNTSGQGFAAQGNSGTYGFQGNVVHIHEMTNNNIGLLVDTATGQNSVENLFIIGVSEHNTIGIRDYNGRNTYIVANTNSNTGGGYDLQGSAGVPLLLGAFSDGFFLNGNKARIIDRSATIGSVSPPASPFVSGTVYQNTSNAVVTIYQPAYATTSGTAGSVAVDLGPTSTPSALYTDIINAGTTSSIPRTLILRVPPQWYYSFTASGATLLAANVQAE